MISSGSSIVDDISIRLISLDLSTDSFNLFNISSFEREIIEDLLERFIDMSLSYIPKSKLVEILSMIYEKFQSFDPLFEAINKKKRIVIVI